VSEEQAALLMLVAAPVLWGLMWLGWRARGRRQAGLPAPPEPPETLTGDVLDGVDATYVSTTTAGQYLDRVVAHGLGVRSAAVVRVATGGVLVERTGAPDVWIPTASLRGARLERGMVGKFVDRDGLVVLTWRLGDAELDTGLRTRHESDRERLVDAVGAMTGGRL
jgi:hypothetical protein